MNMADMEAMSVMIPLITDVKHLTSEATSASILQTLYLAFVAGETDDSNVHLSPAQLQLWQTGILTDILERCKTAISPDGTITTIDTHDQEASAMRRAFQVLVAPSDMGRKRSFDAMDGDSDDASDEDDDEIEDRPLQRHLNFDVDMPRLVKEMERLEWDSDRPIRSSAAEPVWDYTREMNIIKDGNAIFAVKWDKTCGPLTQIGATNFITAACLGVAAFTSCRVMLIATMNNELAHETVEKLSVTAKRTSTFGGLIDVCSLKDMSRRRDRQLTDKLLAYENRMLVLVDSSDVHGMRRLQAVVEEAAKIFPGTAGIHVFIDEIDDTIRRMPNVTKNIGPCQSEIVRDAICANASVVKVHGCTATPDAVFDFFKRQEMIAPALGFSEEWNDGIIEARADRAIYVGLGDMKRVDGIDYLPALGTSVAEYHDAKVGDYMLRITSDLALNADGTISRFVKHFMDDPRSNAMMLISLTDMVNNSADASTSMRDIIDAIDARPKKQPTMKELAHILLHRADQHGTVPGGLDILTINGEITGTKYQRTSSLLPRGSFEPIVADSTCDALSKCYGKLIVIFGSNACRGRSFVTESRVPTHLLMMNGKRSQENAVGQAFGRMTGCHKSKLGGHPPYVLCTKSDFDILGTSNAHGLRDQYRAQSTGMAMAIDLRGKHGLGKTEVPALYPIVKIDTKILQAMLDVNARLYVTAWAGVMRMYQVVEALRNGYNTARVSVQMMQIVQRTNARDQKLPVTLNMLKRLGNAIHEAWTAKGRDQLFVLYAQRDKLINVNGYRVEKMRSLVRTKKQMKQTVQAITASVDSAVVLHGNDQYASLMWSDAMQDLQEKLSSHNWIRLCNEVADRFLESNSTATPLFDDGKVRPPTEYMVISKRRGQGA